MTESEREYFAELYGAHAKNVYGICVMYLKNRADAEEATSDVFVRIMERKPEFENEAHAGRYLAKTAANICKNRLKTAYKRHEVTNEDVLLYMTNDEEKSIMDEVLSLPPKYRVILYMHYYAGYTAEEMAHILSMPISTVLSRMSRGRRKLKDILMDGGFHDA